MGARVIETEKARVVSRLENGTLTIVVKVDDLDPAERVELQDELTDAVEEKFKN